tara:strand:- start:217 stop:891 length:675 start_codon:yes stop_codon:yes gene_type:complete
MAKDSSGRGTGPSNAKNQPNKITIGDGSIRDLAYWLMGGDVSTKRGKKKVSSNEVRAEVTSLARAQMEGNSPYVPDYAAREKAFDETVQRNRSEPDQREYGPSPRGYSNPYANKVSPPDRRAMYGRAAPQATQPIMDNPFTPVSPDRPRPLMNQYKNPRIQQEGEFGPSPEQPRDEAFGDDFGAGFNMGGYVQPKKKKKKKKMMYGGKMKKYAKGGGIRKAKYS